MGQPYRPNLSSVAMRRSRRRAVVRCTVLTSLTLAPTPPLSAADEGTDRSVTLSALEPSTEYEVRVRATNDEGIGD